MEYDYDNANRLTGVTQGTAAVTLAYDSANRRTSGAAQTEYTYEPFGKLTISGGVSANSFAFTGRESDGTGLQFSRARFYDSRTQRFVSEDPIGIRSGTANLYGYLTNSPLDNSDPLGLWILGFGVTVTGGAGAAGTGSFGVYATSSGDFGVAFTGGFLGEGGIGASARAGVNWYNGVNLTDLNGAFVNAGASANVPVFGPTAAVDYNIGRNSAGQVVQGGSFQLGWSGGSPLPGEGHAGVTFTKTAGCNIFSILSCLPKGLVPTFWDLPWPRFGGPAGGPGTGGAPTTNGRK